MNQGKNIDLNELREQAEDMIREAPAQSAAAAVVAGFALALLPIGSIIFGIIRLALHLVKPALLVLGAMKAYEEWCARCECGSGERERTETGGQKHSGAGAGAAES